jgi:hypothetical protein
VARITGKIRNFVWSGSPSRTRVRVAWKTCCLSRTVGGLNLVEPHEALMAMMTKLILTALEPGQSNFKAILKYRLQQYQPFARGRWAPFLEWCLAPEHKASSGSMLWRRTTTAGRCMFKDIAAQTPSTYPEWISANFWLSPGQDTIGASFSYTRAMQLYNTGLKCNANAWDSTAKRFISAALAATRFGVVPTEFRHWDAMSARLRNTSLRLL